MSGVSGFNPASADLFFKSQKTGDPRLGEVSAAFDEAKFKAGDYVIAGYPDDEGIKLNSGRIGAALGPDAIRSRLYKTSVSEFQQDSASLWDIGNIDSKLSLAEKHETIKTTAASMIGNGARWIGLGGGHDFGYPDGAGFLLANKDSKLKPLVLNFDAHLDVRPLDKGLSSGTPFYRLLTDESLPDFDFYEIGIQRQCNSQEHIKWAKQNAAKIIFLEDMMVSGQPFLISLSEFLAEELVRPRPTFISLDIDCFSTAFAMGCSQAWPTGFAPNDLIPFFNLLYARLDVQALGIYEVSPPLDQDERTVKLAAQIVHQFRGVFR